MQKLQGKGVYQGIAVGKLQCFRHEGNAVEKHAVEDVESEVLRFRQALQKEIAELEALYDKALKEVGETDAQIFQIHRMMLEDEEFIGSVEETIHKERVNAEFAATQAAAAAEEMLASSEDGYLKARAADIQEVFHNLIGYLTGNRSPEIRLEHAVILAADDLSPSETVNLDKSKILAFVTARGSSNSHTAILARSMNIPAVVATGNVLGPEYDGKTAVVDGKTGEVFIEPDDAMLEHYLHEKSVQEKDAGKLQKFRGLENVTKDGRKIKIYANAGSVEDVRAALENDAGGIGLFRSEFIFMGRNRLPAEEEQFAIYKAVLESMQGKEVVIRTLDIGADKKLDYMDIPQEQNPAMGCRAVRFCLTRPDIFKTQLRALYRASAFGKLLIMFPMITSVWEVRSCRQAAREAQEELAEQDILYDPNVPLGIMVETPAAALISEELAKEADFFSIGTNDLTQYTLAIDRQNSALERFYNPCHPALLKLIQMTAENAHRHGIWVGICGELAADETLTRWFLDIGLDELSVSPARILPLRKAVRETRQERIP
ncbi:MAG: phosphoenolpyruvate--protein phosphotransferase [Clostridia bacterium]|nr:phosphoenolpyruvate--protein phosphotransferase [Clostridia bacterium]